MTVGPTAVLVGGRNVRDPDLKAAVLSATVVTYQFEDNEHRWRLSGGRDVDGELLDIVVARPGDHWIVVVTVIEGKQV